MSKYTDSVANYVETLRDDARALLHATSDAAEGKVKEARRRLSEALDSGRDVCDDLRERAAHGVRVAGESFRENPVAPIAAALVLGGLIVFLFARSRK